MKNEIKFRAWEKQFKEIIPVYNIDFQSKIINRGSAWRFFREIELMPSTGLKDKNGVEIYEGDILKCENKLVAVFWNEYIASFDCKFLKFIKKESDHKFIDIVPENFIRFKVMGNIYENKELLEEK